MTPAKSAVADLKRIAEEGVRDHAKFAYSEGPDRMNFIHHPGVEPVTTDCSGFVTMVYLLAGCNDPNGLNYDGEGYTGTELSFDKHIAEWIKNAQGVEMENLEVGDLVVYGPGTGEHVAIIVEVGLDPLTVSMGQNGDPSFVHISQDGRQPQTFLRPDKTQHRAPIDLHGAAPAPAPAPPAAPLRKPGKAPAGEPPLLVIGSHGPWVEYCHELLEQIFQHGEVPMSTYTQYLFNLVEKAQREAGFTGIDVDGKVGPKTWLALHKLAKA